MTLTPRLVTVMLSAAIVSSVLPIDARQRATREREVLVSILDKNDKPADGIGPRAQERGLAAARRRAHHDDAARTGVRQEMEQRVAPDQPAFAGSTLRPGAARGWRSIHRASRVLPAGASQERRVPIARTA